MPPCPGHPGIKRPDSLAADVVEVDLGVRGAIERVLDGGRGIEGIGIILAQAKVSGWTGGFVFYLGCRLDTGEKLARFGAGEEVTPGIDGESGDARTGQAAVERDPAFAHIIRVKDPGIRACKEAARTVDRQGADGTAGWSGVEGAPALAIVRRAEEPVFESASVDDALLVDDQASYTRFYNEAAVDGAPGRPVIARTKKAVRPGAGVKVTGGGDREGADVGGSQSPVHQRPGVAVIGGAEDRTVPGP